MNALPRRFERVELAALFFIHAAAIGMWSVPLGNVLRAHGLEAYISFAFAGSAISAFISPLLVGTLADEHIAPTHLLRWLSVGAGTTLALAFTAIHRGWGAIPMLLFFQLHYLCASPTWGLSTSIVLARLRNPTQQFGPLRAWATFGWMAAGWGVSAMNADASTLAGFAAVAIWFGVAAFTFLLPTVPPPVTAGKRTWRELFGLQAIALLKHKDHRVVFITAALFNASIAAFYPFTPLHLREVGIEKASAAMSIGQISEVISMFGLAAVLARFRLKWVFFVGIAFAVVRYALFALGAAHWLLVGIFLHGFAFTLFFVTAQLYLDERVEARMRVRAQALLTLMVSGFGNLAGYLGSGAWRRLCTELGATDWTRFWLGLATVCAGVLVFFVFSYRGKGSRKLGEAESEPTGG